jgi:protein-S-isoprenylcysteine O-methyltransferase Ste14
LWFGVGVIFTFEALSTRQRTLLAKPVASYRERALLLIGAIAIFFRTGIGEVRLFPDSALMNVVAFSAVVAGLSLMLWARLVLREQWHGQAAIRAGHELIREGPYRFVRHPIYSGLALALAGTVALRGDAAACAGLAAVLIAIRLKIAAEDRLLTAHFGERFASYRRAVKAFVPYVG